MVPGPGSQDPEVLGPGVLVPLLHHYWHDWAHCTLVYEFTICYILFKEPHHRKYWENYFFLSLMIFIFKKTMTHLDKHQKQSAEVICEKRCSWKFCKIYKKTSVLGLLSLLKNRVWHRCFTVNFAKLLRTHFLQNTYWRVLLKQEKKKRNYLRL